MDPPSVHMRAKIRRRVANTKASFKSLKSHGKRSYTKLRAAVKERFPKIIPSSELYASANSTPSSGLSSYEKHEAIMNRAKQNDEIRVALRIPTDGVSDNVEISANEETQIEQAQKEKTFSKFSQLPTELRLKIWQLALPGPRAISLSYDPITQRCSSKVRIPIALSICQESREEALRFYQLAFAAEDNIKRVYMDFSIDSLFLSHRGFRGNSALKLLETATERHQIKSLVFCVDMYHDIGDLERGSFKGLEELIMVVHGCPTSRKDLVVDITYGPWDEEAQEAIDEYFAESGHRMCAGSLREERY